MSLQLAWKGLALCTLLLLPQGAEAECPLCSQNCRECGKCGRCCRIKIVNKRNFLPAPPPGFVVGSVPFTTVAAPAFAIAPVNLTTGGLSRASDVNADEIRQMIREELRQNVRASRAAADEECEDPCGDIKQLRKDLDELIIVTRRLTDKVMEDERKRQSETEK